MCTHKFVDFVCVHRWVLVLYYNLRWYIQDTDNPNTEKRNSHGIQ